jgi:hypothetical protein
MMARMTRTQITLEEDEYLFLKNQAAETGSSLSSVVRGLVRARMGQGGERVLHIWELAGIAAGGNDESALDYAGRDHDKVIADALAAEMGLTEDQ